MNKDNRAKGTVSEAEFIVQALKRNLIVSKPFDTDCSYDFIVDSGNNLIRIQVKSCSAKDKNGYPVIELRKMRNGIRKFYTKNEIDFFAIHLTEENLWYILPIKSAPKNGIIKASLEGKYKTYINNWKVLGKST